MLIVLRLLGTLVILFLAFIAVASAVAIGVHAGLIAYFGAKKCPEEKEDGEEKSRDEDRVLFDKGWDDASIRF